MFDLDLLTIINSSPTSQLQDALQVVLEDSLHFGGKKFNSYVENIN